MSELLVSVAERVATLTLNRPERKNALTARLVSDLVGALAACASDPGVGAIVLTGAGGAFCSGADLTQMGAPSGEPLRGGFAELNVALWESPIPIVSKVRGPALAGGLALVCGAHFVYADATATFGTPEIHRGLFPMMVTASLLRVVPRRRALEMLLLGDRMSAVDAEACGLVTRVVASESLDEVVAGVARRLAHNPPTITRLGLEAVRLADERTLPDAMPLLAEHLQAALGTPEAQEGLLAFVQKRPPRWFA